jgi:hypothetical protein
MDQAGRHPQLPSNPNDGGTRRVALCQHCGPRRA